MLRFINFILYSNIFIALCALAMTLQTLWVLDIKTKTSPALLGLVFFSTLLIYALHRLVSWHKIDPQLKIKRFAIIGQYQQHIQAYALAALIGAITCFFYLKTATQLALILPALLSLGYVIPFIGVQKLRLRDIHFVKIFLIAIVWSYVTVLLPILEFSLSWNSQLIGILVERGLFIFAITLPFDLRDSALDKALDVQTIPSLIGTSQTLRVAYLTLGIWLVICLNIYPFSILCALGISAISTAFFIYLSPHQKQDYFFTALIDGTMLIQFLLVWNA